MEDWLDTSEEKPDETMPFPLSTEILAVATDSVRRQRQFASDWESLTLKQKVFLNTWREARFNANRAIRMLAGTAYATAKRTVTVWAGNKKFERVRVVLREASVDEILSKSHLVTRQDDIVETLLTPKPILYQGQHTGFEEVDGSAAARANETLLKVGGHLKDKEVDLNVGIIGPEFNIQVVQRDGAVHHLAPVGIPVALPEPEAVDADWTE